MEEKRRKIKRSAVLSAMLTLLLLSVFFCLLLRIVRRKEEEQPRIFGSTYMTMNNPYFTALNESIRQVVEANGDILITRDPAQDQDRQNQEIIDMIDEGISVLFANAADWEKIGPALDACEKAGVAVFAVDTKVGQDDKVISVIESDNYLAGVLVAKDLMKKMPRGADIVVMYDQGVYSMVERRQGFLDTIAERPEYRIVAETADSSEIEVSPVGMNRILAENVSFDAVFGVNDPTALGALAGLQMNGAAEDILIYGVDGSPDVKSMIDRGQMEGTVAQYPIRMGRIAAETAYEYLEGMPVPGSVPVDVTLITKANLREYDLNEWQ